MNLLLWTTHVTPDHEPQLTFLKECGFDGAEVPLFDGTPDHYKEVGAMFDAVGLQRTCSAGLSPEHNPIDPSASVRQAAVDRLKWAIDCAEALGADVLCGPLHSAFKVFSGQGPTEVEMQRSADVLRLAGAIDPLVALLRGGSAVAKEEAAGALRNLACNDDNEVAIAAAGGIVPLVELTRSGTDGAKEEAAGALGNLAGNNADNRAAMERLGYTP